ncbi:MAG: hypothetical protein AUG49_16365 [Catenulispora sp. 13_1_20CM_3_70_7]|nr:MAG: hypothetical protein AUG49_16365 [Catenulispora sp. 13_1_20CM_3_70_7]
MSEAAVAPARGPTYTVLFPPICKHEAVVGFMRALSGPLSPRLLRRAITVVFELHATEAGLTFCVTPPHGAETAFCQLVSSHLPGVILTPVDEATDPVTTTDWTRVIEIGTSRAHRPLRIDRPDAAVTSILSCFAGLSAGEALAQQWVITGGPTRRKASGRDGPQHRLGRPPNPDEVNKKYAEPVFLAVGRLAAMGPQPDQLLGRVMAQLGSLRTHGVRLQQQRTSHTLALERLRERASVLAFPAQLNATEVAVLAAIPTGTPNVPGLPINSTKRLPAPDSIPRDELVIATSNYPGSERPIGLRAYDLVKHTHVLGRNGVGKSTLMVNLAVRQMAAGYGVALIDPTGDTAADVLERIPPERARDVIVFEPTGPDYFVGFNIFDHAGSPEVLADQLMAIFHGIYSDSGIYTSNYLRAAIQTLASVPGQTLVEVVPFLTDPRFRARIVRQITDPILTSIWQRFDQEGQAAQLRLVQPAIHRVQPLLLRSSVRLTLGQADNRLDMRQVLRERKILIVSIPKGHLGEETSALFGSLVFGPQISARPCARSPARRSAAAAVARRHPDQHPYQDRFRHKRRGFSRRRS